MRNLPPDTPGPDRPLDRRVDGLLQLALAAAMILLASSLVRVTVTHFGYEPDLNRLHSAQRDEGLTERALLDEQAGVRGYQLSADPTLLAPYAAGQAALAHLFAEQLLDGQAAAQADQSAADAAADKWRTAYAAKAVAAVSAGSPRPTAASLLAGERLFDSYRAAQDRAAASLAAAIADERSARDLFNDATGTAQTIALIFLTVALLRRQRQAQPPRPTLSPAVTSWQDALPVEPTGSDPEAIALSITHAACELSGAVTAQLWLAEADGELRRVEAGQQLIAAQRRRNDVALRAHREGAIITSATRTRRVVAVPLLHEGRTIGVVELTLPAGSPEPTSTQTEMLRAWGRQAARTVALGPTAGQRDRVTGLAGRSLLVTDLSAAVERSQSQDLPVSLLLLEIDHLGRHSALGTATRDELVRTIGAVLTDTVRTSDTAYRTDEGSFAVLLPGAPAAAASSLAERLRQIIARRFVERGVTASFGVSTCPDAAQDDAGLMEAAEAALYDAVRFGGNRSQPAHALADELALVRRRATELD